MKLSKRKTVFLIGILVSFFFLYLALRKVNFNEALRLLAQTNYFLIIPAILAFLVDFSIRAFRWRMLLSPIKKCKYINLLSSVYVGFFSNTVFPMRVGEVIRSVVIGEREKISKTSSLATIVVERVLDGFAVLVLLIFSFFFYPFPEHVKKIWVFGVLFFSFFLLIIYGLIFYTSKTKKFLDKIIRILPQKFEEKIHNFIDSFVLGLEIFKDGQNLLVAFGISLLTWTSASLVFFFVAKGMGINEINVIGAAFVMAVTALGISIPSSPGAIGVYEYFGVLAAGILGVPKSAAISYVFLIHTIQIIAIVLVGGFFIMREHLSLIQVEKQVQQNNGQ